MHEPHTNVSITSIRIAVLSLLFAVAACGGGGGGGGGEGAAATPRSSNWDSMVWDQANWH